MKRETNRERERGRPSENEERKNREENVWKWRKSTIAVAPNDILRGDGSMRALGGHHFSSDAFRSAPKFFDSTIFSFLLSRKTICDVRQMRSKEIRRTGVCLIASRNRNLCWLPLPMPSVSGKMCASQRQTIFSVPAQHPLLVQCARLHSVGCIEATAIDIDSIPIDSSQQLSTCSEGYEVRIEFRRRILIFLKWRLHLRRRQK